jgi:hypothetical protein
MIPNANGKVIAPIWLVGPTEREPYPFQGLEKWRRCQARALHDRPVRRQRAITVCIQIKEQVLIRVTVR